MTVVCCEFVCMLTFSVLCDECCLTLHECHVERNFHFFFEFVPAAQLACTHS